jgi:hypothetical protein
MAEINRIPKRWINQPNGVPGLDDNGALVGPIIPTSGTAVQIEAMVGQAGELWYKTDTGKIGRFDGVTPGGAEVGGITQGENFVIVQPTSNATANAAALRNAYATAKALTPYGNAISATNPVYVLLHPGIYDFGTGDEDNHGLEMDAQYVHLVGLASDASAVVITSQIATYERGTIEQTADNVHFANATLSNMGRDDLSGGLFFLGQAYRQFAAYWPSTNLPGTVMDNIGFAVAGDAYTGGYAVPTRIGIEYSGTYHRIDAGVGVNRVFGYIGTSFSGRLTNSKLLGSNSVAGENGTFSGEVYYCDFGDVVGGTTNTGRVEHCNAGKGFFCGGCGPSFVSRHNVFGMASLGNIGSALTGHPGQPVGKFEGLSEDDTGGDDCWFSPTSTAVIRRATGTGKSCMGFTTGVSGLIEHCTFVGDSCSVFAGAVESTLRQVNLLGRSDAVMSFAGLMEDCRIEVTGGDNKDAVQVETGARIYNSTLIATGTGKSVNAAAAANAVIAHCRLNKGIGENVTNLVAAPNNVDDVNIA